MTPRLYLGVIIVTHNHGETIGVTLDSIAAQTLQPDGVVVVDCASEDRAWKADCRMRPGVRLIELDHNAGFSAANNIGWRELAPATEGLVLFLNPDVFLPRDLLERLVQVFGEGRAADFGALSPRLVGWDFATARERGTIDSTGIFPRRWGGWGDRRDDSPQPADRIEDVPALCGAFFFARIEALREVVRPDGGIWDERYFAYKEDVELSLRLRRTGWRVGLWHGGEAGHGRGWANRRAMSRSLRLMSARNELRLHWDYAPARLPYSVIKWLGVALLDL